MQSRWHYTYTYKIYYYTLQWTHGTGIGTLRTEWTLKPMVNLERLFKKIQLN